LTFTLKNLDASHAYLQERGLTAETIAAFGLGYCAKGSMAGRIAIPIHDADGKVVAYAGRWPGNPPGDMPKYKFPNGFLKSLEVYNLHNALKESPSEPLIVVEGFFDCIMLWQAGFRRVVSVMGSSISDAQAALNWLFRGN
jgi:DNA primase